MDYMKRKMMRKKGNEDGEGEKERELQEGDIMKKTVKSGKDWEVEDWEVKKEMKKMTRMKREVLNKEVLNFVMRMLLIN